MAEDAVAPPAYDAEAVRAEASTRTSNEPSYGAEEEPPTPAETPQMAWQVLLFLAMHVLGYACQIYALVEFWKLGQKPLFAICATAIFFSGLFCAMAAWHTPTQILKGMGLPLKDRNCFVSSFLMIFYGWGQVVVYVLAIDDYFFQKADRERRSSTPRASLSAAGREVHAPISRFHCKAVTGMLEGFVTSTVLLYAIQAIDYPLPPLDPIIPRQGYDGKLLEASGIFTLMSAGIALMELDYVVSGRIHQRMERNNVYAFGHFLFRMVEVSARVFMVTTFIVLTYAAYAPWCYGVFLVGPSISFMIVAYYGGHENSMGVKILCGACCYFANIFQFIDSPYKQRAARKLSRILTIRNLVELLVYIGLFLCVPDFSKAFMDLLDAHNKSTIAGCILIPLYWVSLLWVSTRLVYDDTKHDIYTACVNGDLQTVLALVTATVGLDVNRFDVDGKTPLMHAVVHGNNEVVRLLVKENASVTICAFDDHVLRETYRFKCCTSLRPTFNLGWTALHFAAWKGKPEVLSALVEAMPPLEPAPVAGDGTLEANVRKPWYFDFQGDTPLHVAVKFGHAEATRLLVERISDWRRIRNEQGFTPWELARSEELRDILERRGNSEPPVDSRIALTPLLAGDAGSPEAASGEAWPTKSFTISKTEGKTSQYQAPGLCSFVASSGGGVLAQIFLIDTLKNKALSAVPEDDALRVSGPVLHPASSPAAADEAGGLENPKFEELDPVNKDSEVLQWWIDMLASRRSVGQKISGEIILQVPIDAELGKGQYGRVWRAKDRRTGILYAVKNIQAQGNRAATAKNECVAADHMRIRPHPCIVQYFDVHHFIDANLYSLVMEFCPGGDLKEKIHKKRKAANRVGRPYEPPPQALHWIGQIFLGLEHLHVQMDTLLRDMKPDNVVMTLDGRCKITDIGFVRFGAESDGSWTFGVPPGSPGYVAPEVLRNEKYSSKADLYSFGALVWVLLTGGHPRINEPAPPCSRMKHGTDYKALFEDWQILRDCITNPSRADYRGPELGPDAKDFVLNLTLRKQAKRFDHDKVRQHSYLRSLALPPAGSRRAAVEAWLATMPQ